MIFSLRKKKEPAQSFDPALLKPVILVSICTGEETAGFRNPATGRFTGVQLIRNSRDLHDFMETYGITEVPPKEY